MKVKKKTAIFSLLFFLLMAIFPANHFTLAKGISAESAILMEQYSGRILYSKNAHKPMRIASITKIMTAVIAIESGKLDEMVTVSKNAVGKEGSSLYLKLGEKISLRDLVYGLMLRSGNDAAVAIAEYVGGSEEGFVYLMNEKAKEIGMKNTVFSNPHGLDEQEDHFSTAYDMALLTQYAMKNETFREIFGTKRYKAKRENGEYSYWENKNRLLTKLYKYSTGGKTGYTKRAKRTLVSTAAKDGLELICVTLNAPDDWNDHMRLFNEAFNRYELETVVKKGKLTEIDDDFYKNKVYVPYSFYYPLTQLEKKAVETEITLYRPPRDGNPDYVKNPVGKLEIFLGREKIGQIPLFYEMPQTEEKRKKFWQIFFHLLGVRGND